MSEKLTKTAIKDELDRRIQWFEKTYGFHSDMGNEELKNKSHHVAIAFGRYCAAHEMKYQVSNKIFIGGFCA